MGRVRVTYVRRQGPPERRKEAINVGRIRRDARFAQGVRQSVLIQEHPMADLAFVATTIAVFALVVLVAKGVAGL